MSDEPTFLDALSPGDIGDTPLELKLTTRELASVQWVMGLATNAGLIAEAYHELHPYGLHDRWAAAFQAGQSRIGLALARALGNADRAADFAVLLAEADQNKTALDNGTEA